MKSLIIAIALTLIPVVASAQSTAQGPEIPAPVQQPTADETKAVRVLLSGIHGLAPKAQFESAARDPYSIVSMLAAGSGPIADRALEAMFLWKTERTFAFGVATLSNDATPTGRKHDLLMLLAKTYGEQATPVVAEFLAHDDVQLRITAAAAAAEIRTDAAFTALDAALQSEQNPSAKKVMMRYARRVVR